MISTIINDVQFIKDMDNIVKYSLGYLDGIQRGKKNLIANIGKHTIESLKQFIDSNARVNPKMLHHMYEWYENGSPNARLFNIDYKVIGDGLSINYSFRQSTTASSTSTTPFYDKARIMEYGIPVMIRPVNAKVLRFEIDGEEVFTSKDVLVSHPGGPNVKQGFEDTVKLFFKNYFTQAFMFSSGLRSYLENQYMYKQGFPIGKKSGRSYGEEVGYNWISKAGELNV